MYQVQSPGEGDGEQLLDLLGVDTPVVYDEVLKVQCFDVSGANFQCLYRCLSVAIFGDESHWLHVKSEAIDHICLHFDSLKSFLYDENGMNFPSAEVYKDVVSGPFALGSSFEAYAVGRVYHFSVVILHNNKVRFSKIDNPHYPVVTLVLRGSWNSGHMNLAFYLPEKYRKVVFEDNNLPYAIDSPYLRTKPIPFVDSQLQTDVTVKISRTPVKQTPKSAKKGCGSKSNVGSKPDTPNSSRTSPGSKPNVKITPKTPQSGRKRSAAKSPSTSSPKTPKSNGKSTPGKKGKSTRTPGSHCKRLFEDVLEDSSSEPEDELVDPTVRRGGVGGLDFNVDSDAESDEDYVCYDDVDEADDSSLEPFMGRSKTWVPLPATDTKRPTWNLAHGQSTAKSYLSGMVLGDEDWDQLETHRLPPVDQVCNHCGARSRVTEISGLCCKHGRYKISEGAKFQRPSESIVTLFSRRDERSKIFMNNIRRYNQLFQTVSFCGKIESTHQGPASYLEINGKVTYDPQCYQSDNLEHFHLPAQLYFVEETLDRVNERRIMGESNEQLDPEIVQLLEDYFQEHNKFIQCFETAREVIRQERQKAQEEGRQVKDVYLAINPRPKARSGYRVTAEDYVNNLLDNEFTHKCKDFLGAVYVGDIKDINFDNFFVNRRRHEDDMFPNMLGSEASLGTQTYPLIYLHGENSWFDGVGDKSVPLGKYYSYMVQDRGEIFNPLLFGGKLFAQWLLDAAIKIEYDKLHYMSQHQKRLKASSYDALKSFVNSEARAQKKGVGRFVILSKSFKGSPRYRTDKFYAGMAIAAEKGVPSYFVTATTNPHWPEITEQLPEGLTWRERPDIVVKVFEQKIKSVMSDFTDKQLFGEVSAYMISVEFQKRGLPHAHILLIMKEKDRPKSAADVERFIQAEIPPASDVRYRKLIEDHMIHSPCHLMDGHKSKPFCFPDGVKCRFKYPKKFSEHADISGRRVEYKRPNNGRKLKDKCTGQLVDNRNIVPHNKYFLLRYEMHLNVEYCKSDLKAFKYLCIYTHKNPDKAYVSLTDQNKGSTSGLYEWDEISHFKEFRYFGPHEALYTIYGLPINEASHSVKVLNFHLPGQQQVIFEEGEEETAVTEVETTQLEGWFKLNQCDSNANEYTFVQTAYHYNWNEKQKVWVPKERKAALGRLPTILPNGKNNELFALRCILGNARGATSYADLRTVNEVEYNTFYEAAIAMGLLENVDLIEQTFTELCTVSNARSIRKSFVLLMKHCRPSNPLAFWDKFKEEMSDDFAYRCGRSEITENDIQLALHDISKRLEALDMTLQELGLPQLNEDIDNSFLLVDCDPLPYSRADVDAEIQSLNAGQRQFFDAYTQSLSDESVNKLFLLLGAGGCGKSYLLNTCIKDTTLKGMNIKGSAYSGVAATLILNANTVHNTFGVPVNPADPSTAMSNICTESVKAERIRQTHVFIIDEVSMLSCWQLTCIDKFLRLLMKDERPFGNKIMILSGDFRQTLPVVRKGTRADTVTAAIINHPYWSRFHLYELTENVRAQDDKEYADFILGIGDGSANVDGTPRIELDTKFHTDNTKDLITEVFGKDGPSGEENSAILTPLNDTMHELNETIIEKVDSSENVYNSCSEFIPDVGKMEEFNVKNFQVTKEMIENLQHGSLPPHRLRLRIGCIVMLLVNLNVSDGLCNGTRLKVLHFYEHTIKCKIMSGSKKGDIVFLFKIKLSRTDTDYPGTVMRTQFPIRLAYAMTINKSQGQTLRKVGLYLPRPCFSHGQLYTAFSRVRSAENICIRVCLGPEQGYKKHFGKVKLLWTRNEVYHDVVNAVRCHPSKQSN